MWRHTFNAAGNLNVFSQRWHLKFDSQCTLRICECNAVMFGATLSHWSHFCGPEVCVIMCALKLFLVMNQPWHRLHWNFRLFLVRSWIFRWSFKFGCALNPWKMEWYRQRMFGTNTFRRNSITFPQNSQMCVLSSLCVRSCALKLAPL